MKIGYHYSSFYKEELEVWLLSHNIKYEILGGEFSPKCIYFTVWSTVKNCDVLLEELHKMACLRPSACAYYSEKDLSVAPLLEIRPKSITMCIENVDESFRYDCQWSYMADRFKMHKAHHKEQIGTIMITKEPPVTTKTVFWGPDDGGQIIFADKRVADLVQRENLKGMLFQDVLLKNRKPSERIFQLLAEHIIELDNIVLGKGEKEETCRMCGKKQYVLSNIYQLHLHDDPIYREKDFFSTERIFGEGIAQPIYIISQRFYQLLKQNKFTAQVNFIPVILE